MFDLKEVLEYHYNERNTKNELIFDKPDPLVVLQSIIHSGITKSCIEAACVCALLAYGNAKQIMVTLSKLDFRLLDKNIDYVISSPFPIYRFQSSDDIRSLFIALILLKQKGGIENIFLNSYSRNNSVIDGINALIFALRENMTMTRGLDFLIGRVSANPKNSSPFKRWNLFLRWLVRKDNIDLGIWNKNVDCSDLILPLDTHTFRLGHKFNLLKRKTYDLQAAIEITNNLKKFCFHDPVKYDFSLYRLGQENVY